MTLRALPLPLLLLLGACAPAREQGGDLAKARAILDQEQARGTGPVVHPPEARDRLLSNAEKLAACAPARSDVGVLVEGETVAAFDRGLHRDAAMEACLAAALPELEGRVLFVPASLPGGRPQLLRIDATTTEAALEGLDPKTELSIVVARDAAPETITRLVEKLRDRGFERLTLRVEP